MSFTLRFLKEARFGGFVRWLPGDGNAHEEAGREATAIIMLRHPALDEAQPFYAKLYPDELGRSRALVNEVVGYVLADRWALPQPGYGCLHRVPLKKMDLSSLPKHHGWLKDVVRKKPTATWPAFCTQALNAKTPYHHYGPDAAEALRADLYRWQTLHKTLAFDDIVANIDRHFKNLLRLGAALYALIDHGRLVTADGHWLTAHLDPSVEVDNRLLDLLFSGDLSTTANCMVGQADTASALLTGFHELDHWLGPLLQDSTAHEALHNFLQARTLSARDRIVKRYGLAC
jgi:hypothetical protein